MSLIARKPFSIPLFFKIIGAFLCALLVWEIILSNFVDKIPGHLNDPNLGSVYSKGVLVQSKEGHSLTHINSLGMRNEEILPKQTNEIRILVLGDSYTQGLQVSDDELYTSILGKDLTSENKNQSIITVINAGRPGASPAYYLYLANYYKSIIQPDYVVIQTNDTDWTDDIFNKTQNFYEELINGQFESVKNNNFISGSTLANRFPKLQFLKELANFPIFHFAVSQIQDILKSQTTNNKAIDTNITSKGYQQDTALFEKNRIAFQPVMDSTLKGLRDSYEKVVFLYIPSIDYNNLTSEPTSIENVFAITAKNNHVDVINMRDRYIQYYHQTYRPCYGFNNTSLGIGHINIYGHLLIAEKLNGFFQERFR
jgi:lysophospholipase L1-like esterase